MFYYKNNGFLYTNSAPLTGMQELTEEEYNEIIKSLEPTEEEIRAQKEAEVVRLLKELYPGEYEEE